MLDFLSSLSPTLQALCAGTITWLLTAVGAATVFIFKKVNEKVLNSMQGFAAGIMIAASFWSLLQPAIESSSDSAVPWMPAAIGFLLGGLFIRSLDYVIPHMHRNTNDESQKQEGVPTNLNKNTLLFLAITLHN
ncbi:ZIP family metal transporter, partial [Staphylococcus agnetis]